MANQPKQDYLKRIALDIGALSGFMQVAAVVLVFAAAARDEVDMGRLTGTLLGVVEETMQPERISLWINR